MRQCRSIGMMAVVSTLATVPPAFAASPDYAQLRLALTSIRDSAEREIVVRLSDGKTVAGIIDHVGEHSFLIADSSRALTQVPYRNVTQVSAMSTGARVAIIVTIAGVAVWILVGLWLTAASA